MIDFVKIWLHSKYKELLKTNLLLKFKLSVDEDTGEKSNKDVAYYKNLKITVYDSGRIIIIGSLHKYFNNGKHNYNDFALSDFKQILEELESKFKIDLNDTQIQNLEFGVNIKPPIETKFILRGLIHHRGNNLEEFKRIAVSNGDYNQVERQRYLLKAYDKAKQYHLNYQLFRWEIKIIKMIELSSVGIYTLWDLIDPIKLAKLGQLLSKRWRECLYYDNSIDINKLSEKEKANLKDWMNPVYWLILRDQARDKNKNKISYEVNKMKETMMKSGNQIQNQIEELIKEKWRELTNTTKPNLGRANSSNIELSLPNLPFREENYQYGVTAPFGN